MVTFRPTPASVAQPTKAALAFLVALAGLFAACGPPRNEAPVRRAEELVEAEHWEEAAEAFRGLPESVAAWQPFGAWRSASIYRDELNDPVRGEKALAECAKRWAVNDWGYVCKVELGQLRVLRENHRGAVDAFRGAMELRPRGAYTETCLLESGRAYLALDEPAQARLDWQELLGAFPSTPLAATVALEIARSYDLEGDQRRAIDSYRSLIQRFEGHSVVAVARFGLGESLEQLGELEEALGVFRLLIESHPNPGAVRVKAGAVERRIARRNMNQTKRAKVHTGLELEWDAEQGIAPEGDQAVGEPMEDFE